MCGVAAMSGYTADACAQQGSGSFILPGQPFEARQPKGATSTGDTGESDSGSLLGGRFSAQGNLMRTFTSNMYYAADNESKVRAWGWAFQPSVQYTNDLPRLQLSAGVDGTLANYNTPGQHDNYADGSATIGAHWAPLQYDHINFDGRYTLGHDPFGTNRTEGNGVTDATSTASPDKWGAAEGSVDWVHGTTLRGLSTEAKVSYIQRTYLNNKQGTQYENYDSTTGEVAAFYALTAKTQVVLDFGASRFNQPNTLSGFADQSAMQYQVLGGVRWYATSKTFGDIRVGGFRREFDHNSRPDFTGVSWTASMNWNPRAYTLFVLETGQRSDPSYISDAGFINTRYVQAQWMQDWTSRFYTRLVGSYVRSNFVNAGRLDNNYFGALFATYSVTRDFSVFGISAFGRRNSEDGTLDYSRADAFVGIKYLFFSNL